MSIADQLLQAADLPARGPARSSLSEQLESALHEATSPSDMAKTLSGLAKFSDGLWKSEKQARFILNSLEGGMFKDRAAEAWAHKHGFEGKALSVMQRIEGYGSSNVSKARFFANVFVVDNYGVVVRGKVKVVHPKAGEFNASLDWNDVKIEFKRTAKPTIGVDIAAELRVAVAKNRPTIDLIKTIPGWDGKDILVDFMRQLEAGRPLSLGQMAVVQKMVPDKELFLGAKGEWPKHFDGYKKLALKILKMMHETHLAHEKSRVPEYEAAIAAGKYYHWAKPEPDDLDKKYSEAIRSFSATEIIPHELSWIDTRLRSAMMDMSKTQAPIAVTSYGTEEIKKQFQKAMKASKPTKISLSVVTWLQRMADKVNDESGIKRVADLGEIQKNRR